MKTNKMLFAFAIAFVFFTSALLAADPVVMSKWSTPPPKIDGQNNDWMEDAFSFQKNVSVDYAFRNDDRNLYVLFIFKDPKFLSTLETTGMTMFFSTEGKKSKDYAVRFVRWSVTGEQLIAYYEKQGKPLSEEQKQQVNLKAKYLLFLADAVNKKGEVIPTAGASAEVQPPFFRTLVQGKIVTYEFQIPLAGKDFHPAGIGAEPGKTVKVGFEWGGATKEMRDSMASQIGADATKAQDMKGGGLLDGQDAGDEGQDWAGSDSSMERMLRMAPKKYGFWVDVKLAVAQ